MQTALIDEIRTAETLIPQAEDFTIDVGDVIIEVAEAKRALESGDPDAISWALARLHLAIARLRAQILRETMRAQNSRKLHLQALEEFATQTECLLEDLAELKRQDHSSSAPRPRTSGPGR